MRRTGLIGCKRCGKISLLFRRDFHRGDLGHRRSPRGGAFPYFFVGTFIEATSILTGASVASAISLLFRRDFH